MYLCNYIIYVHSLVLSTYLCIVPAYLLELFTNQVFLVCIGWYFLGIIVPTDTKENLVGTFWYQKNGGSPFSPPKRGLWTPFRALSPPFEGKRVSRRLKKNVPRNFKKVLVYFFPGEPIKYRTHWVPAVILFLFLWAIVPDLDSLKTWSGFAFSMCCAVNKNSLFLPFSSSERILP